MNAISKLFSLLIVCSFIVLIVITKSAYAEYYLVYAPEPCCAVTEPVHIYHRYHHRHHHWVPHHRHHHRHYWVAARPKNTYSISVYYACPTYGCCSGWTACGIDCGGICGRPMQVYYAEPVTRYKETCAYTDSCNDVTYVNDDEDNFDLDRRTADDVSADLDIDE